MPVVRIVRGVTKVKRIVTAGPQGPRGEAGNQYTKTAGENISAYRVVYVNPDDEKIYRADNTLDYLPFGMIAAAVSTDADVTVTTSGEFTNDTWTWDADSGKELFLRSNGTISQTPPTSGYLVPIGHILTPDTIFLDFKSRVSLA